MKLKVTEVVKMAWNDHRISLENDDVKIDITVKDTINTENELCDLQKGDEVELPITAAPKKKEVKAKAKAKA